MLKRTDKTMWDYIKYLYKKYYNIPPQVVDKMACEYILELCANGNSNKKIANLLEEDEDYIKEIIQQYFHFEGWKLDLDINPYDVYNSMGKDFNMYIKSVSTISGIMNLAEVRKSFNICATLDKIRKEIKLKVE